MSAHHSFNLLSDRTLWYDGSIQIDPSNIVDYILTGKSLDERIYATHLTEEIEHFNKLNPNNKIKLKQSLDDLDTSWNIPEEYKNIDVEKFVFNKLILECEKRKFNDKQADIRIERINKELNLYKEFGIMQILKTLIYIVDTFNKYKLIWGTGRGSSCSSYILYLIELHDVDSVQYELEETEFFRKG